jgi:hypothetical protein
LEDLAQKLQVTMKQVDNGIQLMKNNRLAAGLANEDE